jgi:hypothetical protein
MSKIKNEDGDDFKSNPFNGERSRWEEFHRHLRLEITKQEDLPEEWLEFLFNDYPVSEDDLTTIIFPPEFITRSIPLPLGINAPLAAQRNRNDTIKRDEAYNKRVRKAKAIYVDILSSCVSSNLKNTFHDEYSLNPYYFIHI